MEVYCLINFFSKEIEYIQNFYFYQCLNYTFKIKISEKSKDFERKSVKIEKLECYEVEKEVILLPVVSFLSVGVVVCAVDGVVVAAVDGVIVAAVDGVVAAAFDGVVAAAFDGVSSSSVLRRFERDVHCERGNQRSQISSKNYNN